jgi:hypothetical protein
VTDDQIRAALLDMALRRGRGRSFCPSEVARALAADWRPLMPRLRQVAAGMPPLKATRRGQEVPADAPGGPIRLTLR